MAKKQEFRDTGDLEWDSMMEPTNQVFTPHHFSKALSHSWPRYQRKAPDSLLDSPRSTLKTGNRQAHCRSTPWEPLGRDSAFPQAPAPLLSCSVRARHWIQGNTLRGQHSKQSMLSTLQMLTTIFFPNKQKE